MDLTPPAQGQRPAITGKPGEFSSRLTANQTAGCTPKTAQLINDTGRIKHRVAAAAVNRHSFRLTADNVTAKPAKQPR